MEAKTLYEKGENVIAHFRAKRDPTLNLQDIIHFSYDLQSGSYTDLMRDSALRANREECAGKIARILKDLRISTVCDAGTGEATTLKFIVEQAGETDFYAFDISVSRLLYAQKFTKELRRPPFFFSADLMHLPVKDNAFDAILTVHAIEPNGGHELQILSELERAAARYLVLVEPDYDLGDDVQKKRMEQHNYVRGLKDRLKELGGEILRYEPLGCDPNPSNRASVIVYKKRGAQDSFSPQKNIFVSPACGEPLEQYENFYFCPADGHAFPILKNIPCLKSSDGILVSHIGRFL